MHIESNRIMLSSCAPGTKSLLWTLIFVFFKKNDSAILWVFYLYASVIQYHALLPLKPLRFLQFRNMFSRATILQGWWIVSRLAGGQVRSTRRDLDGPPGWPGPGARRRSIKAADRKGKASAIDPSYIPPLSTFHCEVKSHQGLSTLPRAAPVARSQSGHWDPSWLIAWGFLKRGKRRPFRLRRIAFLRVAGTGSLVGASSSFLCVLCFCGSVRFRVTLNFFITGSAFPGNNCLR